MGILCVKSSGNEPDSSNIMTVFGRNLTFKTRAENGTFENKKYFLDFFRPFSDFFRILGSEKFWTDFVDFSDFSDFSFFHFFKKKNVIFEIFRKIANYGASGGQF